MQPEILAITVASAAWLAGFGGKPGVATKGNAMATVKSWILRERQVLSRILLALSLITVFYYLKSKDAIWLAVMPILETLRYLLSHMGEPEEVNTLLPLPSHFQDSFVSAGSRKYSLRVEDFGGKKIEFVRCLHSLYDLPMASAYQLSQSAPFVLHDQITSAEEERYASQLRVSSARVVITDEQTMPGAI